MESLAVSFMEEVNAKAHLKKLLRQSSSLSFCLKAGEKEIPFKFQNGHMAVQAPTNQFDAIIIGTEESLHSILTGKEKLRDAIYSKKIEVQATLRKKLLLESLFYLSKQ